MAEQEGNEVSQDEIDKFVGKLEAWGEGLSTTDQNILNLVVSAAAAGTADENEATGFQFDNGFQQLRGGLAANRILFPGGSQAAWVQLGDPWIQGAGSFGRLINPAG